VLPPFAERVCDYLGCIGVGCILEKYNIMF